MIKLILLSLLLISCETENTTENNHLPQCPGGDYENAKLFCGGALLYVGFEVPDENQGDLYSCDEHTNTITKRVECEYGCVDNSFNGFCKPVCEETGIFCGKELQEDKIIYWNTTENSVFLCNENKLPEYIGECNSLCENGECQ